MPVTGGCREKGGGTRITWLCVCLGMLWQYHSQLYADSGFAWKEVESCNLLEESLGETFEQKELASPCVHLRLRPLKFIFPWPLAILRLYFFAVGSLIGRGPLMYISGLRVN